MLRLLVFLPLVFYLSISVSAVAACVACWSLSGWGYWIRHMWRHWLLGLVGWLSQWLDLDLVSGCRLDPRLGKEMLGQTYVQQCY